MAVTGDPSQTDLPPGVVSGLAEAQRILADVEGVAFAELTAADVVRHDLVTRIVRAYDRAEGRNEQRPNRRSPK
jgi:phosphate starvation-inducible PhoH-like protein